MCGDLPGSGNPEATCKSHKVAKYIVEKSLCLRKRTSLKRISVFLPNQAKIRLKKNVEKMAKCFFCLSGVRLQCSR